MLWKGLSSNVMFYKGLLDKLGVRPEVIRHGAYKAAVEPFIMDRMSPENRRQTEELIGTIWCACRGGNRQLRGRSTRRHCGEYASTLAIGDAALAVEKKMVDSLAYSADMEAMLAGMTGQQETRFISLEDYVMQGQVGSSGGKGSGNRIAVLYAEGDIVDGEAPEREVGGETLAAAMADLRRDEGGQGRGAAGQLARGQCACFGGDLA
ncbi:MAG: S49 family peptidase [Alistipes indistinctus]